jgi:deoxyadenosine/deoxycytidine kinase
MQTSNSNQTMIISIEGNIGSGKSTLLANLRTVFANRCIVFVDEPVDVWEEIKDANGTTMLEKFYADQQKYAFSFQIMAYISRLSLLKAAIRNHPGSIIITERSLHTDKMVFAKMLFDNGLIEDVNYQIYLKWFDEFSVDCPLHKVIYVKATPEICIARIEKRSRTGESTIPLKYLQDCHKYHERMMQLLCDLNTPLLLLDGDTDIFENVGTLPNWVSQITKFIE